MDVFGFTRGQFSFVDLIEATLSFTGPADLTLSTWAASVTDLGRVALFCDDGRIGNARFLLDGAFESYNKAAAIALRERFGDENIRILPNHAKFALLKNEEWSVIVQTSMNLNQNKRLENFTITESPEFFDAYSSLVADVFDIQKPGEGFDDGGVRCAARTLGALGVRQKSDFFAVTAGARLLV